MRGFIYGKTEYDMLKNAIHLDSYIDFAVSHSYDFLTITDPKMYASYKFYKKCISNNIKPVIGIEYSYLDIDNSISKVLIYAKNNKGYIKLLNIGNRVNIENINSLSDVLGDPDLLYVFVYFDSYIERLFQTRDFNMLDEYCNNISSNNTYFGISYTNRIRLINEVMEFEEYMTNKGFNILPIHESLYLKPSDEIVYRSLRLIDGEEKVIDDFDDYSMLDNPKDDIRIDNFINLINLDIYKDKILLPKYKDTKGVSSKEYLEALCYKGLERRGLYNKKYIDRLNYELSIIDKMGYNDYFLIVWDFILYSKKNDILVGPGRGSAAGSLATYCLGITEIDPIKYNLFFERFLNPSRVTMPDIDTDFPDNKRDLVIEHVKDIYGLDHICYISAYSRFQQKSSIKELSKIFKLSQERVDKILDMLLNHGYDELLNLYKDDKLIYSFLYVLRGIEGLPHHVTTHAAGIIMSDKELNNLIPLGEGLNGLYQSLFEAVDLEQIGLLKMDFLGISNLTMIKDMMDMLNYTLNDLRDIPLDDKKVYDMFSKGDTLGIFQFESQGITNCCMKLKPKRFMDLVALIALYRPGPMQFIDDYIARSHGKSFTYIHPDLKPILADTYGIIVYQEQIMQIAEKFAGYSFADADNLRRAISKKKEDKLKEEKPNFIAGAIKKGYSNEIAEEIYDMIYKFASYGFNKSHSVAYALFSYQMAYLKCNHLNTFMSVILNNVVNNKKSTESYIKYARMHGLITLKPNVNVSDIKYVYEANRLFMPLVCVFSIGLNQATNIIEERNKNGIFKSYDDFKSRCHFLSDSNIVSLIYSGALDIFGMTKKRMIYRSNNDDSIMMKYINVSVDDTTEFDFDTLRENELKYLGFNLEYDIFNGIDKLLKIYRCNNYNDVLYNKQVKIIGYFNRIKSIRTKNNENMVVLDLILPDIIYKAVIFPRTLASINIKLESERLYIIDGRLTKDNRGLDSFNINNIITIPKFQN